MTISVVGRRTGLRPSAIRYYESINLLPPAARRHGQRVYDARTLRRLAVIRQAQDAGFSLDEARTLLQSGDLAAEWNGIAAGKLVQLEAQIAELEARRRLIRKVQDACQCRTADECGGMLVGGG